MKRQPALDLDGAERVAIAALGQLAGEPDRLGRFLGLTGIDPAELRRRAGEPEMLAAVLDHILEDETLLLVISASVGIAPEQFAPAAMLLHREANRRGRS